MSKQYTFTKMHGCGNDYIYFNAFRQDLYDPETMSLILSDRRVGIGGDGLIMLCPSDKADFKMRIFNADGSEGRMCGNGIRCAAKLAHDLSIAPGPDMRIETLSGIKQVTLLTDTSRLNGKIMDVRVEMGTARFDAGSMDAVFPRKDCDRVIGEAAVFAGETRVISAVSVGTVHCVLFGEENKLTDPTGESFDIDGYDLTELGKRGERDPMFLDRTNVEVVKIIDRTTLAMRVWERGSGETHACGTGACAVVAVACERGLCPRNTDITVRLRGGELIIRYDDENRLVMTGPAATVFSGTVTF